MRIFLLVFLLFSPLSFAASLDPQTKNAPPIERVIYITLDGVRWQEFFAKETFFKKLWRNYFVQGQFYGGRLAGKPMEVASTPISMPSYQSQMAGFLQPCLDNGCGRIKVETFPEKMLKKFNLAKKGVVVFSSWGKIDLAVQHIPETIFSNTGNLPVYDPETKVADPVMQKWNEQQLKNPGSNGNRYDEYTFEQSLHYFEKYKPKFMWLSLVNADDAAHAGQRYEYQRLLHYYDDALDKLFNFLKKERLMQTTLIIVTTDHGRGNGERWKHHGPDIPESKATWGFVLNGDLEPDIILGEYKHYSTLSIRPTIEKALS